MKHVKTFKLFEEDAYYTAMTSGRKTVKSLEKDVPSLAKVYDMFVKINKDTVKEGGDSVELDDTEFYAEQINNIFFDNVIGKDNFPFSEKLAAKLAEVEKCIKQYVKLHHPGRTKTEVIKMMDEIKDPEIKQAVSDILKNKPEVIPTRDFPLSKIKK